jgi:hypothetical protein
MVSWEGYGRKTEITPVSNLLFYTYEIKLFQIMFCGLLYHTESRVYFDVSARDTASVFIVTGLQCILKRWQRVCVII